jgi:hypothetical protein
MHRSLLLALLLLAGSAAPARADFMGWSYDWTASPTAIPTAGGGTLSLVTAPGNSAATTDNIIAAGIFSSPSDPTAAAPTGTISPTPYTLTLKLTDAASGQFGTATFGGTLSGSTTNLSNSFTTPTTRQFVLGDNQYTVTIGPYFKPASIIPGIIGASVEEAPAPAKDVPEPATLALAACALPGIVLGLRGRK